MSWGSSRSHTAITSRTRRALVACFALAWVALTGTLASQNDNLAGFSAALERALVSADREADAALLSPLLTPAERETFMKLRVTAPGATASVRERQRVALEDGTLVIADILTSNGVTATLATWRMRLSTRASGAPKIVALEQLARVADLVRLALDSRQQFAVRDLRLNAPDLAISMTSGTAFAVKSNIGAIALLLHGKGDMRFTPPDAAEQGQIRLFARTPALQSNVSDVFIRANPDDLQAQVGAALTAVPVNAAAAATAQQLFSRVAARALAFNVGDLSRDAWSLTPSRNNVSIELPSTRYGWLAYSRSFNEAEDVSMFDRGREKYVSIYASAERVAQFGGVVDEDASATYDVIRYDVTADIDPVRSVISATGALTIRVLSEPISTVAFRLAEPLTISSVTSPQLGRLFSMRVVGQPTTIVGLPTPLAPGTELTISVAYSGHLPPQELGSEVLAVGQSRIVDAPPPVRQPQPSLLYTQRSYWYPQAATTDYAPAHLRLTVPSDFDIVATGRRLTTSVNAGTNTHTIDFDADRPVRYLACEIAHFVGSTTNGPAVGAGALSVEAMASPRLASQNRAMSERATAALAYYGRAFGAAPYDGFTVALTEALLPGGHSPAYFALINQPVLGAENSWHNDPLAFDQYPDLLLAHEVAHQWWGQAVGFKSYHDQWLSEGLAQYSAVRFLETEDPGSAADLLARMNATAVEFGRYGPISLGPRLGHIVSRTAAYRALVYNKSALVLDMLRRLIGDEPFREGLARFYRTWQFRKAGTDDIRRSFEMTSQQDLRRYFDRWFRGSAIPVLKVTTQVERDGRAAEIEVEQREAIFDVPVTLAIRYRDGATEERTIAVHDARVHERLTFPRPAASIAVKKHLTLARFTN